MGAAPRALQFLAHRRAKVPDRLADEVAHVVHGQRALPERQDRRRRLDRPHHEPIGVEDGTHPVLVQDNLGPVGLAVAVTEHGVDFYGIASTDVDAPATAHGAGRQRRDLVPGPFVRSPVEVRGRWAVLHWNALASGDAGHRPTPGAPTRAHIGHGIEGGSRHARTRRHPGVGLGADAHVARYQGRARQIVEQQAERSAALVGHHRAHPGAEARPHHRADQRRRLGPLRHQVETGQPPPGIDVGVEGGGVQHPRPAGGRLEIPGRARQVQPRAGPAHLDVRRAPHRPRPSRRRRGGGTSRSDQGGHAGDGTP